MILKQHLYKNYLQWTKSLSYSHVFAPLLWRKLLYVFLTQHLPVSRLEFFSSSPICLLDVWKLDFGGRILLYGLKEKRKSYKTVDHVKN